MQKVTVETGESLPLFPCCNFYAQLIGSLIALVDRVLGGGDERGGVELLYAFARRVDRSAIRILTLNWLRPKPSFTGFKLSRDEVDAEKFERNVQIQRYSVLGMAFVIAFITGEYLGDRVFGLRVFADESMRFATVWMGTSTFFLALFILMLTSYATMRYRRAEPRRMAFNSACLEFEQVDAWRALRCDPKFWSEGLERSRVRIRGGRAARGAVQDGTSDADARGETTMGRRARCSPFGRLVAQCKPMEGAQDRRGRSAGACRAKAFFEADVAMLISLEVPSEDIEQCATFAAAQQLEFWNLHALVAAAEQLRDAA